MSACRLQRGSIAWLWILLLPLTALALWLVALPSVTIHYTKEGRNEFSYMWNVQDRIYRGHMTPGGGAIDHGYLFPDEEFFMEFSWRNISGGRYHCISITPKWRNTHIHLDENGSIDMRKKSGTDVDRLKECTWDLAKP